MKPFAMVAGAMTAFALMMPHARAAEPQVARIDLERYLGTWYAIAHYPTRFEKGCKDTQAIYSRKSDGKLMVENRCHRDGKVSTIQGKAWVPDAKEPGKLKVQFFWPFSSDYWVHAVGPNYEWALVGNAKRSNAWILSRTPTLDPRTYDELEEKFRTFGYDPSKLELIPQNDIIR